MVLDVQARLLRLLEQRGLLQTSVIVGTSNEMLSRPRGWFRARIAQLRSACWRF